MRTKRGRVVVGIAALAALLGIAAAPAQADLTGPGTLYGTVSDCPAGVGPIALPASLLTPPVAPPLLVYGAELGTNSTPCATGHADLSVVAELYLLPTGASDTSGVMVDRTVAACRPTQQLCNNVVALGSFAPVPGLYRIVGRFSVLTTTGTVTGTVVGPPFIYTVLGFVASPVP
jgi:hypothetical protein